MRQESAYDAHNNQFRDIYLDNLRKPVIICKTGKTQCKCPNTMKEISQIFLIISSELCVALNFFHLNLKQFENQDIFPFKAKLQINMEEFFSTFLFLRGREKLMKTLNSLPECLKITKIFWGGKILWKELWYLHQRSKINIVDLYQSLLYSASYISTCKVWSQIVCYEKLQKTVKWSVWLLGLTWAGESWGVRCQRAN